MFVFLTVFPEGSQAHCSSSHCNFFRAESKQQLPVDNYFYPLSHESQSFGDYAQFAGEVEAGISLETSKREHQEEGHLPD